MVLRQPFSDDKLKRVAPFYEYNKDSAIPQFLSDTRGIAKYLSYSKDKTVLSKLNLIKDAASKRYFDIKREKYFIEWVEDKEKSGWFFQYSVPQYRKPFSDLFKQRAFSNKQLRYHKMSNQDRQKDYYIKIKAKHDAGPMKMPPLMSGMRMWEKYLEYTTSLSEIEKVEKYIVDILSSYQCQEKYPTLF